MATLLSLTSRTARVSRPLPLPKEWRDVRRYLPAKMPPFFRLKSVTGALATIVTTGEYEITIDAFNATTERLIYATVTHPDSVQRFEVLYCLNTLFPCTASWQEVSVTRHEVVFCGLVLGEIASLLAR